MNEHPSSSCSCLLDHGHWGAGAWHYRRPSLEDLMERAIRRMKIEDSEAAMVLERDLRIGIPVTDQEKKVFADASRLRKSVEGFCRAAAGRPEAFERCPEDRDREARGILRRKSEAREGERYEERMR